MYEWPRSIVSSGIPRFWEEERLDDMVDIRIELDIKCAKCGEYLDHDEAFGFIRVEPCECILEERRDEKSV